MVGGRLRHRLEFWEFEEVVDKYGEPIKQYKKVFEIYGEIRPLTGRETFEDAMVNTGHTHKITIRQRGYKIDPTMQIRYDGRRFEIVGSPANWLERNVFLQMNANEVFDHDENKS